MALYLRKGYELPSDVLKESRTRLAARGKQGPAPVMVEALTTVKRKLEADRAWNQHNSAEYLRRKAA